MRYLSRRLSVDAQLQRLGRGSMPISPGLGRQGTRSVAQQPDGALEAGELGALSSVYSISQNKKAVKYGFTSRKTTTLLNTSLHTKCIVPYLAA